MQQKEAKEKGKEEEEGKETEPKSASQMMFNLVFVLLALGESSFEAMIVKNGSLVLTFCHPGCRTVDFCRLATWLQDRSLLTLHPEPCSSPVTKRNVNYKSSKMRHKKYYKRTIIALQANKQKFY